MSEIKSIEDLNRESIDKNMPIDWRTDVVMSFKDKKQFGFQPETLKANVLLLSYNRPRMLKEAIDSVLQGRYQNVTLWVLDDASDFDANDICEPYHDERIVLAKFSPISAKNRIKKNRVAQNLNAIIEMLPKEELIFYLCDDDIMAPDFIAQAASVLSLNPDIHVVQGQVWSFWDGQDWRTEAVQGLPNAHLHGVIPLRPSFEIPILWWSSGSFGHRGSCWWDDEIYWKDTPEGHSQDAQFILDMWQRHPNIAVIDAPAYYRREHLNTLSAKMGKYDKDGKWKKATGLEKLKVDMVKGMME